MDEGQVAHVGFDQLEHADVGRDPRQDAETGDEHELLDIARRGSVVGRLWRCSAAGQASLDARIARARDPHPTRTTWVGPASPELQAGVSLLSP